MVTPVAGEGAPAAAPEDRTLWPAELTLEQREAIDDLFTYHKPDAADLNAYEHIRAKAKDLTATILMYTPSCADQTAAIRKVREAVMTANAARALRGRDIRHGGSHGGRAA